MRFGRNVENEISNDAHIERERAKHIGDDHSQCELECFDLRLGERLGRDALSYGRRIDGQAAEFGGEAPNRCRAITVMFSITTTSTEQTERTADVAAMIQRSQLDAVLGLLDATTSFDRGRETAHG